MSIRTNRTLNRVGRVGRPGTILPGVSGGRARPDEPPVGFSKTTIDGIRVTISGRPLFDNGNSTSPVVRTR